MRAFKAALGAGTGLTVNKALLAKHGGALAGRAETAGVALIWRQQWRAHSCRQDAAQATRWQSDRRVCSILNGTCNYILTRMQEEHRSFSHSLSRSSPA
jgi:homoserine dehydrogenase